MLVQTGKTDGGKEGIGGNAACPGDCCVALVVFCCSLSDKRAIEYGEKIFVAVVPKV